MADIYDILEQRHVAQSLRVMASQCPFVVLPQIKRMWVNNWAMSPDYAPEITWDKRRANIEANARGEAGWLEKAGLLVSSSIKMPWPPPFPIDPRKSLDAQIIDIAERNENWSFGRRTHLRVLAPTEKLVEVLGIDDPIPSLSLVRDQMKRADFDFFVPRIFFAEWVTRLDTLPNVKKTMRVRVEPHPNEPQAERLIVDENGDRSTVPIYIATSKSAGEVRRLVDIVARRHPNEQIEFL